MAKSNKDFLDISLYRMAVVARMGITDGEFTEEECRAYIAEKGQEHFKKVLEMPNDEFLMLTLKELLGCIEERSKR